MSALRRASRLMSEAEYLEFERSSEIKHEYLNGNVFDMTGASRAHNLISGNVFASLHRQLRGKSCEVYHSDMRLKVSATGLYTYPDISVVCGEAQFRDEQLDTLLNPTLIVEVLSPPTERYDRGKKFQHYRELDSLRELVLISQDSPIIERYVRQAEGKWLLRDAKGLDATLELTSIGCKLSLAEIYEQVSFTNEEDLSLDEDLPN